MVNFLLIGITTAAAIIGISGIRIVRPTQRLVVETLGKFSKTAEAGLTWMFPMIQSGRYVNITEQMADVPPQMVTTSDKLNMEVDAVVYYKVGDVKAALYNVDGHREQLTSLARTTLRAVMGTMTLEQCIQNRNEINAQVEKILDKETDAYGVKVLRVEVQQITPPKDVQHAMNEVIKAQQQKIAAKDIAIAAETRADGMKKASIKKAEGQRQSDILNSEGIAQGRITIAEAKAKSIRVVNEASEKYFKGNAQKLKQLEVTEEALKHNSKVILGAGSKDLLKLFDLSK